MNEKLLAVLIKFLDVNAEGCKLLIDIIDNQIAAEQNVETACDDVSCAAPTVATEPGKHQVVDRHEPEFLQHYYR